MKVIYQNKLLFFGISFALGTFLLYHPAYAPALDFSNTLDDLLRFCITTSLFAFLIKKIQNKFTWSNQRCIWIGLLLLLVIIISFRPQWNYWKHFFEIFSILGLTALAMWSLGSALLRRLKIPPSYIVGSDWLAITLGGACISTIIMWTGWLIGVWNWLNIGLILGCIFLSSNRSTLSSLKQRFLATQQAPWGWVEWFAILCLFRIALTLLIIRGGSGALTPITGFDALWYRMSTPKMWLYYHSIDFFNPNGRDFAPGLMESFFLIGLSFHNEIAAKAMHALFGIMGAGACWVLGHELGGRKIALLSTLLYFLIPAFLSVARSAYVDAAGTCFLILAVWAALRFFKDQNATWILIIGILSGGLAGFRYQGLLYACIINCVFALWLFKQGISFYRWGKYAFTIFGIATIVGGGWYIRNWVELGNPVYPFAHSLFGGQYFAWDEADIQEMIESVRVFGYPKDLWNFILSPFRFYMDVKKLDLTPQNSFGIVPILGWIAMLFGFFWKRIRFAAIIFLLCWAAWFFGAQIGRYSLPFMGLASVLGAIMVGKLGYTRIRYGMAALLLLVMLSIQKRTLHPQPYPPLLPEEKQEHLHKHIRYFPLVEYLQQHASETSCLYTIAAPAWFYYPNQCLYQSGMGNPYRIFQQSQTGYSFLPPQKLIPILCELKIEYLAINAIPFGGRMPPPLLPEKITNLHDPVYDGLFELLIQHNRAVLYRFQPDQHCSSVIKKITI